MKSISTYTITFWLAVLILALPGFASGQNNCTLKKDKDNIKVYSCKADDSDFKIVRAEFELNATIEQYIATVLDVPKYKGLQVLLIKLSIMRCQKRMTVRYNIVEK